MARFADFVDGSLRGILRDRPASYRRYCVDMADLCIAFDVSGERGALWFDSEGHRVSEGIQDSDARIEATHESVIRLGRGEVDLIDVLKGEDVKLFGTATALGSFHEALLRFVNLTMKCPSAQREFNEYVRLQGSEQQ